MPPVRRPVPAPVPSRSSVAETLSARIESRKARIGVVGLGYVGLPLACEFARAGFFVTGYDVDRSRVASLKKKISYVQDVSSETIASEIRSDRPRLFRYPRDRPRGLAGGRLPQRRERLVVPQDRPTLKDADE